MRFFNRRNAAANQGQSSNAQNNANNTTPNNTMNENRSQGINPPPSANRGNYTPNRNRGFAPNPNNQRNNQGRNWGRNRQRPQGDAPAGRPNTGNRNNPSQGRPRGNNNPNRNFNASQQSGGRNFRGRGNRPQQRPEVQPNQYYTANAINWGSRSSYNFSTNDADLKLKVIPISGLKDVGTNCTVLEYGDDILIIDAGLGFAGGELPGVDSLVPNLSYLHDKKDKIRGMVITHGHTDHIGGIQYVIEDLGFPMIYAPKIASELLKEKSKENGQANSIKITEIDGDSSYYLGKFHISHFKMTHTIPDNYGLVIDTPVGRVVTPSDYKFDLAPYKESPSDYSKLAKLGDEGILLLMHESTNAPVPGWSAAETDIAKDLGDIIRDAKGRLLIGMFSTMVNRIRQIIELADTHGKKVAVLGRSLDTIVKISHRLGYIDVLNTIFVPFEEIKNIPDDRIVILTTGSQGEENAALMRMAQGQHSKITLKPTDTVVFSSKQIPGNEGKISDLINMLTLHGCKVLVSKYLTLHASGHGNQDEHKLMLQLTKPKFLMPIHGNPTMLTALKDTALTQGYTDDTVILCQDGDILELTQNSWNIAGRIDSTPHWVEGNRVGDFDPDIIKQRKVLTDEGVVIVSIKDYLATPFVAGNLEITHKGFFVQNEDEFFYKELPKTIVERVTNFSKADNMKEALREEIKRQIENDLVRQYDKRPVVVVSVL